MGFWQICTPIQAQNMVTNPTPYIDTTGYYGTGGSIARDATLTRRSIASIKVTPTSGSTDGVYWLINLTSGSTYVFSVDLYGYSNVPYKVIINLSGSTQGSTTVTGTGYWNPSRLSVSFTAGSTASYALAVQKNNSTDTHDFWTDGWQLESGSIASTYIDGAQQGCSWDASPWISTSTRSGQSRAGGRLINFDTYNLTIQQFIGTGMPPVQNIIPSYGLMDGGYFQRQKALPRNFALVSKVNAPSGSVGLNTYHASRKAFLDALKIDLVDPQQAFLLRYNNGQNKRAMWIKSYYQAGGEQNFIEQRGFTEDLAPAFVCPDPFFYEEGINVTSLGSGASVVASVNQLLERITTGSWTNMGGGVSSTPQCFAPAPDGGMYVGGNFGNAGTGSVVGKNIAEWLGGAWKPVGGGVNNTVRSIAISPAGNIYIGGDFTTVGSGALSALRVAWWNPVTQVWATIGSGFSGTIDAIIISPDGFIYAAGLTGSSGSTPVHNIAKWNGAGNVWQDLGGGTNGEVFTLACDAVGNLYAGGLFTTVGSNSLPAGHVAMWNTTTGSWNTMNGGVSGSGTPYVMSLAVGPDGMVYIGGYFQYTSSGSTVVNSITRWNGYNYSVMHSGSFYATLIINSLCYGPDGYLYAGGNFSQLNGFTFPAGIAMWTGSVWIPVEVNFSSAPAVAAISFDPSGNLYLALAGVTGTVTTSIVSVLSNSGTKAAPIFTIVGPGQIWKLVNFTTGKTIFFNNLTLSTGETVTIDLTPGKISVTSSFRGNIMYTVANGSHLSSFALLNGNNNIAVYVYGSTGATTAPYMQWRNTFWTVDGGAN